MAIDFNTAYKTGKFADLWGNETPSPELVATIAVKNPPNNNQTALDIGCGAGSEAIFLAQVGYQVIGVDLSEEALIIAKDRSTEMGLQIQWKHGDALNIPVKSESIDFINDRGCFHIIPKQDRTKYSQEIYRVLKSGGTFLLRGCGQHLDKSFFETLENEFSDLFKGEVETLFEPITEEAIKRFFPGDKFSQSPVFLTTLSSRQGTVPASLVYLTKL
jgi:ubiquinone/menaquinone biosynthesis C-methylase UbiE